MSDRQDDKRGPRRIPLLPLRDIVVFPHMVVPLFVGREKSISALEEAMGKGAAGGKEIFLSAQRKAKTNEPIPEDIFTIGTIGTIIQLLRLPDGTVKVLVEGKRRASVRRFTQTDGFFMVEVEEVPDVPERSVELDALMREVHATFETYVKLNKRIAPEILISVQTIEDPGQLAGCHFLLFAAKRLPQEFHIDLGLPRGYLFRDLPRHGRKVGFRSGTMDNHHAITRDAEIAPFWIDEEEPVALLFPYVSDTQLIGIQEFNDPSFQRHAYNSVICLMRC
jgi:Lon protease-like protein